MAGRKRLHICHKGASSMNAEFIQFCFSWPAVPFSALLVLVMLYWMLVTLGGLGIDLLDIDFDVDTDIDHSLADWGMVGIRWFNLGDVPLMVWLTALALSSWLMTVTFDRDTVPGLSWETAAIALRNFGIGLLAAKLLTQPLKGKLKHREPNTLEELLGRHCSVRTSEITADFGQIECPTDNGAPLLLNARTHDGPLPKGSTVEIVDYSPEMRLYFVRRVQEQIP